MILHALAFLVTYDIRLRSKIALTVIILDTLGALQEQVFSAIAQSLYSKRSSIHRCKSNNIKNLFS